MVYTRVNWEDLPSTNTPRNADNLNIMDAGIKENDERLNGTKPINNTIYANDFKCKNLLDISCITNISGVTRNNDVITINGGFQSTSWTLAKPFVLTANTTYTMSLTNTYADAGSSTIILRNGTTNIISLKFTDGVISYTPTQNTTIDTVRLFNTNVTYNNYTFSVQLEIGSEATSYTPYKNFENEEIYSTEETKIGTWINGKPLYGKVLTGTTPTVTTSGTAVTSNYSTNVSNADLMFISEGFFVVSYQKIPFNYFNTSGRYLKAYLTSNNTFTITSDNTGYSEKDFYVVLKYTKTTD